MMKKRTPRSIRQKRIRRHLIGTSERPRLNIFRSLKNITAQIIDDTQGRVLLRVATADKQLREKIKYGGNAKAAAVLGEILAQKAKEKGISKVAFDRAGYRYHGRVKAFAEAARKAGLGF
ncbi:MAG: 50S ribosomal protein L18 [Candidatus Omnitrophota bacterium]